MARSTFAGIRLAGPLALLAGLFAHLAAPASAHAQSALGEPRWLPWLGCWAPSAASPAAVPELSAVERVCVFPDAGAGVRLASITDDRITTLGAIPGVGLQQSVSREGCAGWERATWGRDGKRLFRRTELICDGGTRQVTTGMFVLLSAAEWAEIEATTVGAQTWTRIVRYREAADTTEAVRVVIGSLAGRSLAMRSARMAAATVPTIDDVIEASRQVDPAVVEAWLVHRRPALQANARDLARLADAGVATPVIDVVVELSHPGVAGGRLGSGAYAVTRLAPQRPVATAVSLQETESPTVFAQDGPVAVGGGPWVYNSYNNYYYYRYFFDRWGFHPYSYYGLYPYGGFGIIYRTGLFAYPRYRSNFPSRYYYDPYYPPYYPPYGPPPRRDDPKPYPGRGTVIVINPPSRTSPPAPAEPAPPPGRAVNGRGYTRSSSGGGTAGPAATGGAPMVYPPAPQVDGDRGARTRGVVASPGPRATSGPGASGGGSSGGGGSTGRTAQPRQDPPKPQPTPAKGQASSGQSSGSGSSGSGSSSGRTAKTRPPGGA